MAKRLLLPILAIAGVTIGACGVHQTDNPTSLTGPSTVAISTQINAIPDRISQDGASQSSVTVHVSGPDGRPVVGRAVRMDMLVGGEVADYGTLLSRSIVTGSDGSASTAYTAPAPVVVNAQVNTVTIRAIPIGTDAQSTQGATVDIRLMPVGVILPPAGTPTSLFTFSPAPVTANVPVRFDASTSTPGTNATSIATYAWTFGDGSVGSGVSVQHSFTADGTYNVILTVTNDRGVSAFSTQQVPVVLATAPIAGFVFSPSSPSIGQTVFFNGDSSKPGSSRTITQFSWNFGDGGTAGGVTPTHAFNVAGIYNVTLAVLDDSGQKGTASQTVTVLAAPGGVAGSPVAKFTSSPLAPVVNEVVVFDSSSSTVTPGRSVVDYAWNFGDDTPIIHGNNRIISHQFGRAGTFVVNVVITDDQGAFGQTSNTVVVGTGNPLPVITFSPAAVTHGVTNVSFSSASSLTSGGATISTYAWDFGDGSVPPGNVANPSHIFAAVGTFTVRLTITDSAGRSGTVTISVSVS